MSAAFGWGLLAASSLVIGAVLAFLLPDRLRVIGLIMGFGAGVLISAVAFDLVEEATEKSTGHGWVAAVCSPAAAVFFVGDRLIERMGGGESQGSNRRRQRRRDSPLAIVLGIRPRRRP